MYFDFLDKWIDGNKKMFENNKLIIEHFINHSNKKIEMGVSNTINKNAGSFELLPDGTCDIMIIDFKTDEPIFYDTIYLKNISELEDALLIFISKTSQVAS